jgi:POT family proton-dependent oligopeptide transporter
MPGNIDDAAAGAKIDPSMALSPDFRHEGPAANHNTELPLVMEGKPTHPHIHYQDELSDEEIQGEYPTEEEVHTLRRVADHVPFKVYTLAFVELCERFSYYGTTVVCK